MSKSNAASSVVIGIACAMAGFDGGLLTQRSLDASLLVTGDQLNRLAIFGACPIEKGDAPFRNCTAKKLPGVVK